jgi:O-antigen/teichoic acid export membrane protein
MNKIIDMIRRPLRSGMARNAAYLLGGQGVGFVLIAVNFVILARLLGPVEYGIFAGVYALTNMLSIYTPLGAGTVLLRYVTSDRSALAEYWGNLLLVITCIGGLMVVLLSVFGPHLLNQASTSLIPFLAVSNCILGRITTESSKVFQAFEQMRITAVLNMLTNFVRVIAAAVLFFTLHRVSALQWAMTSTLVTGLAAAIAIGNVTVRFGWPRFTWRIFAAHGTEGFGYSFANSTASAYNDLDKTMLSHFGMNFANGIYTMAYRVVDIASMPVWAILDASMPRLFQLGRSGLEETRQLSFRLLSRGLLVATLLVVSMLLFSPLLPWLVGKGFAESVAAIRWLCFIPIFRATHQIVGNALTGAGLQRFRTAAQFTAALLNFLLNLWLIPMFSWHGAAWSSLATDGSLVLMNFGLVAMLSRKSKGSLELVN